MTLRHEPDLTVADWIAPRLGPFGARVGSLVPRGFEAYARVLHPASDREGRPVRWSAVAATCGTTLHPTAQFWRLVGAADGLGNDAGQWDGDVPDVGNLAGRGGSGTAGPAGDDVLTPLVAVLGAHTVGGRDAEVVAGLWEGYGWVDGAGVAVLFGWTGRPSLRERLAMRAERAAANRSARLGAFAPDVLAAPRFQLPQRAYLLFRGPLGDVPAVTDPDAPWFGERPNPWRQSPNLLWPIDTSWCLASEIDLNSTVVGGSVELVEALLAHPDLEVLSVSEDDSLMADGDTFNV